MSSESVFDRDRRIRDSVLTMAQTFYLTTLNQFVGKNPDAWPSQAAIAWAMNATPRAVRKWQTELEKLGVIQVEVGRGRSATNRYRLNLDSLERKEEPRSALNKEPRSSFTADSDSKRGTTFLPNEEPRSYEKRNHVPTERTRKEQKKEQAFLFPSELNSEQFKTAWSEWVIFRREIKKQLTPSTVAKQLKECATWGPEKATRSIHQSIKNGWRGLFDPDKGERTGGNSNPLSDIADQIQKVVARVWHPDTRNNEEVRAALANDAHYRAVKETGIGKIADQWRDQSVRRELIEELAKENQF